MGRPLNKKYFGNRNIGSLSTTADNKIGGEGVATAAVTVAGSYTTNRPSFTFTAPELPSGVTATGTITSEVLSAAISGTQTRAYPVTAGAISYVGGTTTATFTATLRSQALTTVAYASATTISFDTTTTAYVSGTNITISGASITGNMTIGGTTIAAGQTYYLGVPTNATTATLYATYADSIAATSPLTISNGTTTGATFTVGATYSTVTALTPVNRGAFETLVTGAQAAVCDAYGEGLEITPTYRAKSVTITEKGSGYVAAPTIAGYTNRGGITVNTIVLTTDSGSAGSSTNQENSIKIYAVVQGGNRSLGDVVKQVNDRAYKVKTDDGTQQKCVLKTSGNASSVGEADITAYDSDNGEYFVYKLTSRKAVVVPKSVGGGTQFASGTSVPWTLGDAEEDYSVKIDNA